MQRSFTIAYTLSFLLTASIAIEGLGSELLQENDRQSFRPDQTKLPAKPPAGAIMLLGESIDMFVAMSGARHDWHRSDHTLSPRPNGARNNHIVSRWHFRDADIHVEFKVNSKAGGNSGIYIHGNYELQILDSAKKKEITMDDQGSIYGFSKPLTNAARPAGVWQVYDIRYTAPRRNSDGVIGDEGYITAWLNGKLVQKDARFGEPRSRFHPFRYGTTPYLKRILKQQKAELVGPLFLQEHDSPVQFRNVWIRPRDEKAKEYTEDQAP